MRPETKTYQSHWGVDNMQIAIRNNQLATHKFQLATRKNQLATHKFNSHLNSQNQLATRNSQNTLTHLTVCSSGSPCYLGMRPSNTLSVSGNAHTYVECMLHDHQAVLLHALYTLSELRQSVFLLFSWPQQSGAVS